MGKEERKVKEYNIRVKGSRTPKRKNRRTLGVERGRGAIGVGKTDRVRKVRAERREEWRSTSERNKGSRSGGRGKSVGKKLIIRRSGDRKRMWKRRRRMRKIKIR